MRSTMKMAMLIILLLVAIVSVSSCKKTRDGWKANGGIFFSSAEDYIVISQSGGQIMDVYKLKNEMVQSCSTSDGWLFLANGNPIYLGGDVKTIRLRKDDNGLWEKYHEYHMEFESKTYRELYN